MIETKAILLCSTRMALPALQLLVQLNMLAVVVVPSHQEEMVENVQFVLRQTKVPILTVDRHSFSNDIISAISQYQVTLGLMITFSFLLPSGVYSLPKQGFYNIHPGPLPQYRGADPIFQQIKNKEKQAGICIHQINEQYDTGPILMQEMIRLHPSDTYGMVTSKLSHTASKLITTLLKLLSFEVPIPVKVQNITNARYFKKHGAKDVTIRWQEMDNTTIVALVNACNPWNKGATTRIHGRIVRILEAAVVPANNAINNVLPGTILSFEGNKMIVSAAANGSVSIGFVYMDEGYVSADRLPVLGITAGARFEDIG